MKRIFRFLIVALPLCLLTGCWDSRDPEEREYIISLGVDLAEDGYVFTFSPAKTTANDAMLLQATGKTLASALTTLDSQNSRKTDLGQMKMLVLSQSVLEAEGTYFSALLDEMERTQTLSSNIMLLATEGSAKDCLTAMMEKDSDTGLFLWDFYRNTANEVAITTGLDLNTLFVTLSEQNACAVLPRITSDASDLHLGGGIVLVGGKYATTLSDTEERGLLLLWGDGEGAVFELTYQEGILPLCVTNSEASIDVKRRGETMVATYEVQLIGDLLGDGGVNFSTADEVRNLENLYSTLIKTEMENTIAIAQAHDATEVLGVPLKIRQKYGELSGGIAENVEIVINLELRIRDTGRIR